MTAIGVQSSISFIAVGGLDAQTHTTILSIAALVVSFVTVKVIVSELPSIGFTELLLTFTVNCGLTGWFKLPQFDSAITLVDSFRHYIKGNKLISDFHKVTLLNFLKYYKIILRLTGRRDKLKLRKLLTELENSNNTKEKKWMKEITKDLLMSE